MPERDIFIAALQRDDQDARRAYLAEACGADDALRARVEDLLAVYDRAASFLESPPAGLAVTADLPAADEPGTVIGSYKLLERIGEGGFGVVYMAEQVEPVRRKVALKVLKPGMDTRQVVARFEAERQALAIMDHPNIARVFDGGATPAGRPYFVMELVRGLPITQYCDDHRLGVRDRLALFADVCRAVQHAHQKGVIHRDLKPSNVLVSRHDTTSVVKVIDFGVAKALGQELTDKTLFTGLGQMVGTPLYMSPEQAGMSDMDVDTRSDVYSLGVLLYELLTGTTPFKTDRFRKAAYDEIRRIIREEDPPRPSTRLSESKDSLPSISAQRQTEPSKLTRAVQGELDWIVMRCLEKDRSRRYETANGLAQDVERYLADEPVLACPPSAAYRLRKFARRNRASLMVAGLVLFFLVVLGTGVGWAVRDRAARDAAAAKDKQDREEAVDRDRDSRVAETGRAAGRALAEARDWLDRERLPEAAAAVTRAEMLVAAAEADDATRAAVRQARRDVNLVTEFDDIRFYESTAHFYPRRGSVDPDVLEMHRRFEQVFARLGIDVDAMSPDEVGRRLESDPVRFHLAQALETWSAVRHSIMVAERHRGAAWWQRPLLAADRVDPDEVRARVRAAIREADYKALYDLATAPDVDRLSAATATHLARTLRWSPTPAHREAGISALKKVRARQPDHYGVNMALGYLLRLPPASRLEKAPTSGLEEAVAYFRAAEAIRPDQVRVRLAIGGVLMNLRREDEAVEEFDRIIQANPKYTAARHGRGIALDQKRDLDGAAEAFRQVIEIDPNDAIAHENLGIALWRKQDREGAIRCWQRAVELDEGLYFPLFQLGAISADQGDVEAAVGYWKKAIVADPKAAAPNAWIAWALTSTPDPGRHDPAEALQFARRAVGLDPKDGIGWRALGAAEYRAGNWKAAAAALDKAVALRQGGESYEWYVLAMAHARLGEKDAARGWYDRAVKWADANRPADPVLHRLRAEAAGVLGIETAPPPREVVR